MRTGGRIRNRHGDHAAALAYNGGMAYCCAAPAILVVVTRRRRSHGLAKVTYWTLSVSADVVRQRVTNAHAPRRTHYVCRARCTPHAAFCAVHAHTRRALPLSYFTLATFTRLPDTRARSYLPMCARLVLRTRFRFPLRTYLTHRFCVCTWFARFTFCVYLDAGLLVARHTSSCTEQT